MPPSCKQRRRFAGALPAAGFVVLAVLLGGCGDSSEPARITAPPPPPLQIANGSFMVTAGDPEFDGCNSTLGFDKTYEIVIDGTDFSMGPDWTGDWDASRSQGRAESDRVRIGVRCVTTNWTTVNITFTSEDEFFGSIVERLRVDGDCATQCSSSWLISGVRQ